MTRKTPAPGGALRAPAYCRALVLLLSVPVAASAVTRNWTGTTANNAPWSNASFWGGTVPSTIDDAWLNVAGAYTRIDSTVSATGNQIVIGRSVAGARLDMTGGTLTSTGEILVGQYAGASGAVNLSGGVLSTGTNFSVGGAGTGALSVTGGTLNVGGTFHINRYTGNGTAGVADIYGGAVSAGTLFIGSTGDLTLDATTLTLGGDKRTLVNGYISSGALGSYWGSYAPLSVAYNSSIGKTTVTATNGRKAGMDNYGPDILGQRTIAYDFTGVRRLAPAPAAGVHPRVYFNSDELPAIRARLAGTAVGQEAFKMVQLYTSLLRNGRASAWDAQPSTFKLMPDGTSRIGNVGLYDRSVVYNQLVAGNTTTLATMANDGTGLYTLAGLMSLEAFECLVNEGQPGIAQRQTNLAAALDTWAAWALTLTDYPGLTTATFSARSANAYKFGGHLNALTYDLIANSLSTPQRDNVRKALAKMMGAYFASDYSDTEYTDVGVPPESSAGNHVAINSFKLLVACAIEGEVSTADAGYSSAHLDGWFKRACSSYHKFFTYGWFSNGAPLEGQGKNYLYGAHLIPLARRGFDYFGHPHVQAYKSRWLPAVMQPFGYSFLEYDILGGSGPDSERGRGFIESLDYIALKWMFPADNAADFAWRNFVRTEYKDATGNWQSFIDLRDAKFGLRSVYNNQLLPAAIFAADVSSSTTWTAQNTQVQGSLDYIDNQGGTVVARSGYDADATQLLFHVRQDMGGHTFADRNAFTFSALGRLFVNYNSGSSNSGLHDPKFHSIIEVDGLSMKITPQEGQKMRIPAKLAAWTAAGGTATFATGDATYGYTNEWKWNNYTTPPVVLSAGYVAENNTHNTFRRTGNKIPESFGDAAFVSFPHWEYPGKFEGIQKKAYNPMRQVYRTIGLVRGAAPYALVIDDVRKDDATHTYKWFASVPKDLSILTGAALPAGCDPATDVVLAEPAATGNRRLLVRIMRAEGTPAQAAGSTGSTLAYLETVASPATTETWNRLVIERTAVVAPEYRVLLFPFRAGDALPVTTLAGNNLTVAIGAQSDSFAFTPRTATVAGQSVTMSEFTLNRAGSTLIDYRNQIEPVPVR